MNNKRILVGIVILSFYLVIILAMSCNFAKAAYVKFATISIGDSSSMFSTDDQEMLILRRDGTWSYSPVGGEPKGALSNCNFNPRIECLQPSMWGCKRWYSGWECNQGVMADSSANGNYDYFRIWNSFPGYNNLNYDWHNWKVKCIELYAQGCQDSGDSRVDCGSVDTVDGIYACDEGALRDANIAGGGADYVEISLIEKSWGRRWWALEIGYEQVCNSYASFSCYDNDVYWYDSCGNRETKKEECVSGLCAGSACIVCNSHAFFSCYDNDVYWYDSCGNRETKKEECISGLCTGSACMSDPDIACDYCTSQGYKFDLSGGNCPGAVDFAWKGGLSPFCCGNNPSENYKTRICDSWCLSNGNDDACCNSNIDCVYNNQCYSSGTCYSNSGYCNSGAWHNPDNSQTYCNTCLGSGRWDVGGEIAQCCGDDAGENYAGSSTGKSCDGTDACCKESGNFSRAGSCAYSCPNVTNVFFTDMAGNTTFAGNKVDKNDYVKMKAQLPGIDDGTEINLTFMGLKSGVKCYEDSYIDWVSEFSVTRNIQVAGLCDDSIPYDSIKFRAALKSDPTIFNESLSVAVDATESNSPPRAIILNPKLGDIVAVNTNVNFLSGSYDVDDPITLQWTFGDGSSSNQIATTHMYLTGGPRVVTLTVNDQRGLISQDRIGIMVNSTADDPPLAWITSPANGQRISGLLITFDALNSTDDIKIDRSPACAPATGKCWETLNFRWEFNDGFIYQADGTVGAKFTRLFDTAGPHTVKLSVDDGDPVSSFFVEFSVGDSQNNISSEEVNIISEEVNSSTVREITQNNAYNNTFYCLFSPLRCIKYFWSYYTKEGAQPF